jgi:hypothetical protein
MYGSLEPFVLFRLVLLFCLGMINKRQDVVDVEMPLHPRGVSACEFDDPILDLVPYQVDFQILSFVRYCCERRHDAMWKDAILR